MEPHVNVGSRTSESSESDHHSDPPRKQRLLHGTCDELTLKGKRRRLWEKSLSPRRPPARDTPILLSAHFQFGPSLLTHLLPTPTSKASAMVATSTASLRFVRDKYMKHWSTHSYKMEYDKYFSNHLLHGLVALADLGATESHVEGYAKHYVATKLCPVNDRTQDEEAPAVVRLADADALLGKRENFEGLRAMYEAEIRHITADGAITQHLPKLIGGLAGSLLHGLIQLGYAYRAGGDLLIAEGLAYMHFSYLSFDATDDDQVLAQQGEPFTRDAALALARSVQKDTALLDELHSHLQAPAFTNVVQGDLQRRVMSFSSDATLGDPVLFNAVKTAVDRFDFRNVNGHFALDFATWLYHLTPTNDFVLLHATTSAWSLHQVEHLLAVDDRVRAWKVWFRMALGAFIMHEAPELPAEDPCEQAATQLATMSEWDEIIAKTLALEGDVDEHVYKLVQVAHDIATTGARSPDDDGNAPPSSFLTATQREFVTRSAALKVISSEFAIAAGHNDPNDA